MTETPAEPAPIVAVPHTDDDFDAAPAVAVVPQSNSDGDDDLGDAGKKALDRMKSERNEATKRLKALERELAQFRQASMSDAEKAVAEAETRGYTKALGETGKRLARASFDALAARRNPDVDTDDIVEFVDMGRFLADDGEIDRKALQAAVNRLVPERPAGPPSFDGGARTSTKKQDMNSLIRAQSLGGRSA